GTTAIQLAHERGARVYATAGSAEKVAACLRLGADGAVNYKEADFAESVRQWTDGRGVDVVLDMVGASYFARNLRCLAMDGRLVLIAFLGGAKLDALDLTPIMTRRLHVSGSTMRPRTAAQKAEIADALRREVWPVLSAGRCGPVIAGVFPLDRAADAHRLMESSAHIGKIVLRVAE
nr:zinc-binding dehydrogenase [Pseudomonadota bacterium]